MKFTFNYSNQGVRFELILAVQFSGFIQFYRRIPASCSLLFFSSLKDFKFVYFSYYRD